jgi:O-antigen ligase/tetratricopeptide (TPR) repeat protein
MKNLLTAVVYAGLFSVPCIALFVTDFLFMPYISGKGFAFWIIVEIVFTAWVLLALYDKAYRPAFSWIAVSFAALVGVMFFANVFGHDPYESFWGNLERMDSYVTLVHVFLFFMVLGSVLHVTPMKWVYYLGATVTAVAGAVFAWNFFGDFGSALWSYQTGFVTIAALVMFGFCVVKAYSIRDGWNLYFHLSVAVAILVSWYAFAQFFDAAPIIEGTKTSLTEEGIWRVQSTFGNSTFLAAYMLFQIFLAALLCVRTSSWLLRSVYGTLIVTFLFVLLQTGTRGAVLGLAGGILVTLLYLALFAKGQRAVRSVAIGTCAIVVVLGASLVIFRDSSFVQNDPRLERIAEIGPADAELRFLLWGVAFEGIKERPVLGWGQGNYEHVFNSHYNPLLYREQAWSDRVHNVILDWLVAGGVIGAFFYFCIFAAVLFYIMLRPFFIASQFTVNERGVLLGLLAAYFFQNLFVFDTIMNYVGFASILAFIHTRVASAAPRIENLQVHPRTINNLYAPMAGVLLLVVIYAVNVPGIATARDIQSARKAQIAAEGLRSFEKALSHNSFATQEVREQMMRLTPQIFLSETIPTDVKQRWFARTEEELLAQIAEAPHDARGFVFLATFYRIIGELDQAKVMLEKALQLSPQKVALIHEQGTIALLKGEYDQALGHFKHVYDLVPDYTLTRELYAIGALYAGDDALFSTLISTEEQKAAFAENAIAVTALFETGRYDLLKELLALRITLFPKDLQARVNLAKAYAEEGNIESAVHSIEEAIEEIPSFRAEGEAILAQLRRGTSMQLQ